MNKRSATLLYIFGALLTLVMAGIAIWPDFEASNFSETFRGDKRAAFSCPIAMTASESPELTVTIRNPLERRARFAALSFITAGSTTFPREDKQETYIEAGERGQMSWAISADDAVYERMVLARVYVQRSGSAPSMDKTCGIWVFASGWIDALGMSGQVIYWGLATLGMFALVAGGIGASGYNKPLALVDAQTRKPRFGVVLTGVLLALLLAGVSNNPIVGIVVAMVGTLLLISLFDRAPT